MVSPVALVAFGATPFVLHGTGLYDVTLRGAPVHELVHVVFVVTGVRFFWPIVGLDPTPHRLPHVARLGLLFLAAVMLGVVAAQWMAADEREAAREDRRLDVAAGR